MPRYYFHVHDDLGLSRPERLVTADLDAAHATAAQEARLLMCELLKAEGRIALHHRVDIEDADGAMLLAVPFRNVVTIED